MSTTRSIASILAATPIVAVVTVGDVQHAVPLARALARGGVRVMEVPLRTTAALDAIKAIATDVPEILLGVGTVLKPGDFDQAARAGATFAISPGATPALLQAAKS